MGAKKIWGIIFIVISVFALLAGILGVIGSIIAENMIGSNDLINNVAMPFYSIIAIIGAVGSFVGTMMVREKKAKD